RQGETGTVVIGCYMDGAAMNNRQFLRQCEANSMMCAALRAVGLPLGGLSFKDRFQLSWRYVQCTIRHGNCKVSRRHTGAHVYGACGRAELDNVRYQVDQDRFDLGCVEGHIERFDGDGKIDFELLLISE